MPAKPTRAYVSRLIAHWQRAWQDIRERDDRLWEHFRWQNPIAAPRDMEVEIVRSGLVPDTAARLVGIFAIKNPEWEVIPVNLSRREAERDTNIELWLKGARDEAGQRATIPFYTNLVLTGRAVWQVTAEPYLWSTEAGYPTRQLHLGGKTISLTDDEYLEMVRKWRLAAKFPIVWRSLPSTHCWYRFSPDGELAEVFTRKYVRYSDLAEQYGKRKLARLRSEGESYDPDDVITVYEYWNSRYYLALAGNDVAYAEEEHDYMLDPSVVLRGPEEHAYGTPPFVIVEALTTDHEDPEDRIIPPLQDLYEIAEKLDRLLSMHATHVRNHSWPSWIFRIGERGIGELDEGGRPRAIAIETGKVTALYPDEAIEPLVSSGPDPAAMQQIELHFTLASQVGLAPVARGITKGVTSGFMQQTAFQQAVAKLNAISVNLARGYERWARLMLHAVEVIGEPVPVFYASRNLRKFLEIGPDDIKDYYRIRVHYEPDIPNDMIQNMQVAVLAKQSKLLDDDRIRQDILKIQDSDRVRDALLLQEFWESPLRKQALFQKALEKHGELALAENMQAQQRMLANFEKLPPGLQRALATRGIGPTPQNPAVTLPGTGQPGVPSQNATAQTGGLRLPPGRAPGLPRRPGGPRP